MDDRRAALKGVHAKYAPFARLDNCGVRGDGPYTLRQLLKMGVAVVCLLPVVRLIICTSLIVACAVTCVVVPAILPSSLSRMVVQASGKFYTRAFLFVLGFYHIRNKNVTKLEGYPAAPATAEKSRLSPAIVSNHVSMFDIFYHMSDSFPGFVAKSEIANVPLIGTIAKNIGSVFVRRDSKDVNSAGSKSKGTAGDIMERAKTPGANPMLIFSEGTTTNGAYLLPFRTSAFISKLPVQPVVLLYGGRDFSPAYETIGAKQFLKHAFTQWTMELQVLHLPVYYPSEAERESPQLYAQNVRSWMAKAGNIELSDLTLTEKREYHEILKREKASDKKED